MRDRTARRYTAETWPIAISMNHRKNDVGDGRRAEEQDADEWAAALGEVAAAGFSHFDPFDSWIAVADLSPARRSEFMSVAYDLGLSIPAISTARRSVIDPEHGDEHLAYSHRVIDAAAEIGAGAVSVGLFGPLTEAQKNTLWFWTVEGVRNPDDAETWRLAVERLRDLGRHAGELGLELALEMYEDTYLGSAASAARLCTEIDLPNVRVNCDIGNLVRLHRPMEDWRPMMETLAPFAGYWHAKNYFRMEDGTSGTVMSSPAPLRDGVINWRGAIRMALDAGFRSAFCLEHYGGDSISVCAANRNYLRDILRASEVTA